MRTRLLAQLDKGAEMQHRCEQLALRPGPRPTRAQIEAWAQETEAVLDDPTAISQFRLPPGPMAQSDMWGADHAFLKNRVERLRNIIRRWPM
jgi:hypothetical protein